MTRAHVFLKTLEGLFIDRIDQNEEITAKNLNDIEFLDTVSKQLLREVYDQIHVLEKSNDKMYKPISIRELGETLLTQDHEAQLVKELDRRRGHQALSPYLIMQSAKEIGLDLTVGQFADAVLSSGLGQGDFVCPSHIVEFICNYVSKLHSKTIFDPAAGFGRLLIPLVEVTGAKQAQAITLNPNNLEIGKELDKSGVISWLCGDLQSQLDSVQATFDVIASFPPWGGSTQRMPFDKDSRTVAVRDNVGNLLILKSLLKLSENGVGIFVVPPNFLQKDQANSVYKHLQDFGLRLDAFISLPAGTWAPYTSIQGGIAILRRGAHKSIFVGELINNPERTSVLLENLRKRRQGKEISVGRLVQAEDFRSYDILVSREREELMAARLGLQGEPLSGLIREINATKASEPPGFEDRSNAVYLPAIGHSDAVASLSDLRMKPHNYFQLVIDSEQVDSRYLAGFFNTPLGFSIRESAQSGTIIPKITKSTISEMKVYFPDLPTQTRTVQTQLRLNNLFTELNELEEQVWRGPSQLESSIEQIDRVNREDRFPDWLEVLPFPLATILWAYHAAVGTDRTQYEHLDHFFEALAEFQATLLLSAFATDPELFKPEQEKLSKSLESAHLSVSHSSFGTWVTICGSLMKTARTLLNGKQEDKNRCKNLFRTQNVKVLEALLSSKLISVLQETNGLRNNWRGHGGVLSEPEAKRRKSVLEGHLAAVRSCFGNAWESYVLILPSALPFDGTVFSGNVQRVVGTRTPFAGVKITSTEPLVVGQLYFKSPDEPGALRLLPLVKIMPSPRTAQNACYYYNRQERDGVRFISYHFESEAEVKRDFPDTIEAIQKLFQIREK